VLRECLDSALARQVQGELEGFEAAGLEVAQLIAQDVARGAERALKSIAIAQHPRNGIGPHVGEAG